MLKIFPRINKKEQNLYNWTLNINFLQAVKNSVRDAGYAESSGLEVIERFLLAAEKLINKEEKDGI